jgi:integrase
LGLPQEGGIRDRALLAVLADTGCRVGELTRLRVRDYRMDGGHRTLAILGKGGKERSVPLHPEAFGRVDAWIEMSGTRELLAAPLFPLTRTECGEGRDGFGDPSQPSFARLACSD